MLKLKFHDTDNVPGELMPETLGGLDRRRSALLWGLLMPMLDGDEKRRPSAVAVGRFLAGLAEMEPADEL